MRFITLRPIKLADSSIIYRTINCNREYLRRWLTFIDTTVNEESTERYIKSTSAYTLNGNIVYVILYKGEIIGLIGYEEINYYRRKAELGYWIFPEFEGLGFMSMAVKIALNIGFSKYEFNRIEIKCAVGNFRSIAIAKKFGFTLEGIERDGELLSTGKYVDVYVYSLLLREYIIT